MGLEGWAVQSLRNGSIFRLFSGFFYLPQKAGRMVFLVRRLEAPQTCGELLPV